MASFFTSLYLLSFKQSEIAHSSDLDCVKTSNKHPRTQGLYSDQKKEFFLSRCSDNKQNWAWNKTLKYVEKLMSSYKCIFLSSELDQSVLLFFSNGSIVSIKLNSENNTLKKVEIDNKLCGKFIASRLVDVIFSQDYIFVTYAEPKLAVIQIKQEASSLSAKLLGKKKGKLIGFEPKVTHIDLIGPSSKSLERKLALNSSKDLLLVWWRFSDDDLFPWTPVGYAADRANILIYSVKTCIEVLCTVKVNGELINATFSNLYANQIFTIEETKWEKGINSCVSIYEVLGNQCHHVCVSKLPLQGKVLSFHWGSTDKLIIADSNNFILIYDSKQKTSIVKNLHFLPKHIIWHPQDFIALVVGTNGQVQCFDAALTWINFKLLYNTSSDLSTLELNSYFAQNFSIQKMLWEKSYLNNSLLLWLDSHLCSFILIKFTFGSMTRNSLGALELTSQYLKLNCLDEALLLLRNLSWWHSSELHFQCLSKIANFLLRKPLDHQVQGALEMTLGTFFNNIERLPKRILKLYEHKVNHLARRFFHHLLRHYQFRKAFLLAVDLESQDLFLDLSHVAKERGENVLALVALHKANELDRFDKSSCSSSTASNSSISTSTASNDSKWKEPHEAQLRSNILENSSHKNWLPIPENFEWTNNWSNLPNKDCLVRQSPQKSSCQSFSTSNGSFKTSDTYLPYSAQTSYDYNSVYKKLPVLPTSSSELINSSQLSFQHNQLSHNPSNSSTFCDPKLYPNDDNRYYSSKKHEQASLQSGNIRFMPTLHQSKKHEQHSFQSGNIRFMPTLHPRPLPKPPCYSKSLDNLQTSSLAAMHIVEKKPAIDELKHISKQSVIIHNTVHNEHEEVEDPKIKLVHFGII